MINKKGIMGSSMATLLAFGIMALLIAFFFLISSVFIDKSEKQTVENQRFLLEDSDEVISLMKTPVTIDFLGEQKEITIAEILFLYSEAIIEKGVVTTQIKESLESSYGTCFGYLFESKNSLIKENWEPSLWPFGAEWFKHLIIVTNSPESTMNLPSGKFVFRNVYAYCLQRDTIEACDVYCGVSVQSPSLPEEPEQNQNGGTLV